MDPTDDEYEAQPYVPNEPLRRAAAKAPKVFRRLDDKMPG